MQKGEIWDILWRTTRNISVVSGMKPNPRVSGPKAKQEIQVL